jgi:hypothetical protein
MVVSIHQPYYLPWLGYFEKIAKSDIFVFLDDAQYEKNNFYNRNMIRAKEGRILLTVPVKHSSKSKMNEVEIDNGWKWQKKHFNSLATCYSKAKNWKEYEPFFRMIYLEATWKRLIDLNMETIRRVMWAMKLDLKRTFFSSEMKIETTGTQRLVDICQKVGATKYYSGSSGRNYMDMTLWEKAGIEVEFQNFHQEEYKQAYPGFEPNCSAIDKVLNE